AGVGEERRLRRLRRHVHLAHGDRGRARRWHACHGPRRRAGARKADLRRAGEGTAADPRCRSLPRVRARKDLVIVRWGLDALPSVLAEVGSEEPLLVTTERWRDLDLPADTAFYGVQPHGSPESVAEATDAAEGADGLLAVGGGSAIDTAKAVS